MYTSRKGVNMARKQFIDKNVYELAKERIRHAYSLFDTIAVSFSGGKDSTAALNVTLEVARELGKLPLKVFFFDEEAIPYQTEEYVRRVYNHPDIDMDWWAMPQKSRNGASHKEPYIYYWNPADRDRWVREMPPEAKTEGALSYSIHKFIVGSFFPPEKYGTVGIVLGVRAQESILRYRAVTNREKENYITQYSETTHKCEICKGRVPEGDAIRIKQGAGKRSKYRHKGECQPSVNYTNKWKVYPIYDWTVEDVWTAPKKFGWDYNTAYDVMEMAGVPRNSQRCSPAFGQEAIEKLWAYKVCFPEIWEKMIYRARGANTALRYGATELYGYKQYPKKPKGMKWEEFIAQYLNQLSPELKVHTAKKIKDFIKRHYSKTSDPILVKTPHPVSAISWEFLLKIAIRTDTQDRKQPGGRMENDKIDQLWEKWRKEYDELKAEGEI